MVSRLVKDEGVAGSSTVERDMTPDDLGSPARHRYEPHACVRLGTRLDDEAAGDFLQGACHTDGHVASLEPVDVADCKGGNLAPPQSRPVARHGRHLEPIRHILETTVRNSSSVSIGKAPDETERLSPARGNLTSRHGS